MSNEIKQKDPPFFSGEKGSKYNSRQKDYKLNYVWKTTCRPYLLAKAEYWATFLRTSAAVNLTDFVSGDSSSPYRKGNK